MCVAWCQTLMWLHASIHCQLQCHLRDRTYSQQQKVPRGQTLDKLRHVRNNAWLLYLFIRVRKFENKLFEIIFFGCFLCLWFFQFDLLHFIFVNRIHSPSKTQSIYVKLFLQPMAFFFTVSLSDSDSLYVSYILYAAIPALLLLIFVAAGFLCFKHHSKR